MTRGRIVLLALVVLAGLVYANRGTLGLALMERALPRIMAADPLEGLEDGLHLTLCGAGSPLPDPNRSGPCVAVIAGEQIFIVDAGSGAARNMQAYGINPAVVGAVLLTHFHSDHMDGLGELMTLRWAGGNYEDSLPLYGAPGVDEVARGFNLAYRQDKAYRVAHHGDDVVPASGHGLESRTFELPEPGKEVVFHEEGDLTITAFRVEHDPIDPAIGYRFDYKGRSAVITGDTIQSAEIERISKDVDLLVHEALAAHMVKRMEDAARAAGMEARAKILFDIQDYHATPVQAAESAQKAGARALLLYHIVPPLIIPGAEAAFLQGVSAAYDGPTYLGRDGLSVSLLAGSDAIDVSGD